MARVPKYRARMDYQLEITSDSIIVEFNGTPYEVGRDVIGGYGNSTLMTSTPTKGIPLNLQYLA